jgi:glycosyltransferase involved in cell wall biosynthesis
LRFNPSVTACVPYFRCRKYIRRAVQSLLNQTYYDLKVIVVNDGDPTPPWDLLRDIHDHRLVRFDLHTNNGPYYASAVVLNATGSPYFLIQDADDWSDPRRTETLVRRLRRDGSDFAVSDQFVQGHLPGRGLQTSSVLWRVPLNLRLTSQYMWRGPHHGLYRTKTLRALGGYYGGFRMSYDAFLINMVIMTGRISHVESPLYHRTVRLHSLTTSATTGMSSEYRRIVDLALAELYGKAFGWYQRYLAGEIDAVRLVRTIRGISGASISSQVAENLRRETDRLVALLDSQ